MAKASRFSSLGFHGPVKLEIFLEVGEGAVRTTPKRCRPAVTSSLRLHPSKQALLHGILRQMGWLGPSTSPPEGS
jgi:hypothetical protein